MITSTAYVKFGTDGLAGVDANLRLTGRSHFQCCIYEDRPPILAMDDAHVSVSISPPDSENVTADDVATARLLATELDRYITDLERWATAHDSTDKAADRAAA
jgi:hypothetical protein